MDSQLIDVLLRTALYFTSALSLIYIYANLLSLRVVRSYGWMTTGATGRLITTTFILAGTLWVPALFFVRPEWLTAEGRNVQEYIVIGSEICSIVAATLVWRIIGLEEARTQEGRPGRPPHMTDNTT